MAANKLENQYKPITDTKDRIVPKINACLFVTLPRGIGLRQVLDIIPSISASYHIFKAPAAPAPNATKNKEIAASIKSGLVGAITMPTRAVNITNDITLGFINSKKLLNIFGKFFTDDKDTSDINFSKPLLLLDLR